MVLGMKYQESFKDNEFNLVIEVVDQWIEDPYNDAYLETFCSIGSAIIDKLALYHPIQLSLVCDLNTPNTKKLFSFKAQRLVDDTKIWQVYYLIDEYYLTLDQQYYFTDESGRYIPLVRSVFSCLIDFFVNINGHLTVNLSPRNSDKDTYTLYLLYYLHYYNFFHVDSNPYRYFITREIIISKQSNTISLPTQKTSQNIKKKTNFSLEDFIDKNHPINKLSSESSIKSLVNKDSDLIIALIKDRFSDATILNIEFRSNTFNDVSLNKNDSNSTIYTQEGISLQDYYDFYQYLKVNNNKYFWRMDLKNQNIAGNRIFKTSGYSSKTISKKIGFLVQFLFINGVIDIWYITLGNLENKNNSRKLSEIFLLFKLKEDKAIDTFLINKFREHNLFSPNKPEVLLDIEKDLGYSINDQLVTLLVNANITNKNSLKLILTYVKIILDSELVTPPDNNLVRHKVIYPFKKTIRDSIVIRMLNLIAKNINSVQNRDLKDYTVNLNDILKKNKLLRVKLANREMRVFDYFLDKKVIFFKSERATDDTRRGTWAYHFYILNGQMYTLNNKTYIAGQTDTDTNTITEELVYKVFQRFYIEDKQLMDTAIEVLNKAEIIFQNDIDSLKTNIYYHSNTIKGRLLEIINYVGNYVINTSLKDLNLQMQPIIYSKANSTQGKLLKYLLENNIILIMRKEPLDHKKSPLQYYLINGQNDPYPQLKTFNKLPVILNVIKDSSIGLNANQIQIKAHLGWDLLKKNIDILLKYNIIFISPEYSFYYFPTIKERVVNYFSKDIYEKDIIQADINRTLILADSIIDNNLDINDLVTVTISQKTLTEYNKMSDISSIIEQLILDGDIQFNEDSGDYEILRNNINPLLGLIPHPNNGKNKQGKYPDPSEVSYILDSEFRYNMKVIQLLQYLQQLYMEKKPPPSLTDITNKINLKELQQTGNHKPYHLGKILFEYGLVYKYEEITTNILHYAINPKITNSVDAFLDRVANNSILDFGFGFHEYHIAFNYLVTVLVDYRQHYNSVNSKEISKLLETVPDMEVIRHGLEVAQNKIISMQDITTSYFNLIDLNDKTPEDLLFAMCNQIKQAGKLDKYFFGQNAGVITIDLREFHCRNKNNAHKAISDFVTLLTWNHPSKREPLLTKARNKSLAFNLMQEPTEVQLVNYMEHFWLVFAEDLYNENPVAMLETIDLILRYCDGGEIIIKETNGYTSVVLSKASSFNTKFYEYLIDGISLSSIDIIVPDVEIHGKNYSKKNIIDLLIASIVTSTTSYVDMLGDPLTPGDKIGNSAFNGKTSEYHLSGHSDSARCPPKNWLHLLAFIDRLFGDEWWIPAELKGLVGLFNIEFKNAHSRHLITESQINYLLGNVDTNSVPAYENIKSRMAKRTTTEYNPRDNRNVAYQKIKKYETSTLNFQNTDFHKLIFYILGILGGKHRSIVIFSRPMEYINEEISDINYTKLIKKSINTIVICSISLKVYKAIESFQKILKIFYEGKGSNIELERLFNFIGILCKPDETNPQVISIDSVEENFLGKLVTYLNNPHSKFNNLIDTMLNNYK